MSAGRGRNCGSPSRCSDRLRQPATPPAAQPPALASVGPARAASRVYEVNCANELAKAVYNCGVPGGSAVLGPFKTGAFTTRHGVEWDYLAEVPGDSSLDPDKFASCLRPTNGDKPPEPVKNELSSPPISQNPSPQRGAIPNAAVVFEFSLDSGKWSDKLDQLENRLQTLEETKIRVLLAGLGFPEVKFQAIRDRLRARKDGAPVLPRCSELHNRGRLCLLHCTRTFMQEVVSVSQSSARQLKELAAKQDLTIELLVAALGLADDAQHD